MLVESPSPSSYSLCVLTAVLVGEDILGSSTHANGCAARIFSVLYSTSEPIVLPQFVQTHTP
jgi:hypothetical protein